jgi:MFS family permease
MLVWHLPSDLSLRYKPRKELLRLFIGGVCRRVAMALFSIFSPVYMYGILSERGFELTDILLYIALYYIIIFTTKIFSLSIAENLSRVIGFKTTMKLSAFPYLLFVVFLLLAVFNPLFLIVAALLWGLQSGLFWWGYHGYFVKAGDKNTFGRDVGEAGFLETVAVVITPIIGAGLATAVGFWSVFVLGGFFVILTVLFLGGGEDLRQKTDIKFTKVIQLMFSKKSISLAYLGSGAEVIVYTVFWPIFLFLFFGEVLSMGAIVALSTLFAALFAVVVGEMTDIKGVRSFVALGSPLVFVSWVLRYLLRNPLFFVVADTSWNLGQRMVSLPLNALSYRKATKRGRTAYSIMFRELAITIGPLVTMLIFSLVLLAGGGLESIFVIAGLFSLFPLVAIFRKRF